MFVFALRLFIRFIEIFFFNKTSFHSSLFVTFCFFFKKKNALYKKSYAAQKL